MAPFERGEERAKPVLDPHSTAHAPRKRGLRARGMVEAVTWSFQFKTLRPSCSAGGSSELRLPIPLQSDLSDMRPSLLRPGRGRPVQSRRGFPDAALFEVGQIFRATSRRIN